MKKGHKWTIICWMCEKRNGQKAQYMVRTNFEGNVGLCGNCLQELRDMEIHPTILGKLPEPGIVQYDLSKEDMPMILEPIEHPFKVNQILEQKFSRNRFSHYMVMSIDDGKMALKNLKNDVIINPHIEAWHELLKDGIVEIVSE